MVRTAKQFFLYLLFLSVTVVCVVFFMESFFTCPALQEVRTANQVVSFEQVAPWEQMLNFTGFNNDIGTADGHYIVPNFVHFIKFGQTKFSFPQAVCVLAALKHQRPDKLFIHTDVKEFQGKYWQVLLATPGFQQALVINKMRLPTKIFNQTLRKSWARYHGGDVARMEVLRKYGGIYLDSDSYVVRSLDDFRRYEFTLGWHPGKMMGNQIILCHKDARFLALWHESYRNNYRPYSWYFNAGQYPTEAILNKMPYLVHRVEKLFGNYGVKQKTYMTKFKDYKDYYALHILSSRQNGLKSLSQNATYPVEFDEINVLNYPVGFRTMCLDVYPYSKEVLSKFQVKNSDRLQPL